MYDNEIRNHIRGTIELSRQDYSDHICTRNTNPIGYVHWPNKLELIKP